MRQRLEWTARESVPARSEVLKLQGLPDGRNARPRVGALLDTAFDWYVDLAEPRAIVDDIAPEAFAHVYQGEGRNAPSTPLDLVYPRAEGLALFVATVGEPVTAAIRYLFARNEPALAAMLDSVASAAADRLAALVVPRYLRTAGVPAADRARALTYSPGYCGWDVSGQRELFRYLKPEEIGVTLNASCLMQPLKSVSGVIVAGPGRIHRFAPDYPFCAECAEKPCRARISAVLAEDP